MEAGGGFTRKDLEAVLARRNEFIDVDIDDLEALLRETQLAACRRTFHGLTCQDIMTKSPLTVLKETDCSVALKLLERRAIKALPVRDTDHRIVGIVTRYDIHRELGRAAGPQSIGNALGWLLPGRTTPIGRLGDDNQGVYRKGLRFHSRPTAHVLHDWAPPYSSG